MSDPIGNAAVSGFEAAQSVIDKLLALAGPRGVFGEPRTVGEQTLITATENIAALGYGFGTGPAEDDDEKSAGGGGSGGFTSSRPVALITVGPQGVKVEPVVDGTKVAIAFITMLGTLLVMLRRMRQAADDD